MKRFKEIVVLAVGITPQIVTETVYGLIHRNPPVIPDEIYLITTEIGRNRAVSSLFHTPVFETFRREFNLSGLSFDTTSILVVPGEGGIGLADITAENDNEAVGDFITSFIRDKTGNPSNRLHCSIAGGRKTMGFYMGAALQLFGRPWDKLYHVLVTPEFESNPDFFYKPRRHRKISVRRSDGIETAVSTKEAVITLAELPYIRLREKLDEQKGTFRDLVEEGQANIDHATVKPKLSVSLSRRELAIGHHTIGLKPMELAIYATLLRRKTDDCKQQNTPYCGTCTACYLNPDDLADDTTLKTFAETYGTIYGGRFGKANEMMQRWRATPLPSDTLRQNISKINKTLRDSLNDPSLVKHYEVTSQRRYGATRYGIRVDKGRISIE